MNDPLGNPQEIFWSHLPVGALLLVIFVPSRDQDGQLVDQEYWVDEILTTLGTLFRGATAYPRGRGVWRDDARGGTLLTRIIHQLEQSTSEDPFGGWMLLNPPVSQDHHAPKARASEGLDRVQSGLSAAIRRTSA
jgi:hypothetical protein